MWKSEDSIDLELQPQESQQSLIAWKNLKNENFEEFAKILKN